MLYIKQSQNNLDAIPLPTSWKSMRSNDVELLVLDSKCAEFGEVESLFSSGFPGKSIVKVATFFLKSNYFYY